MISDQTVDENDGLPDTLRLIIQTPAVYVATLHDSSPRRPTRGYAALLPHVRKSIHFFNTCGGHVPMRIGLPSFFRAAITLSAVILPVAGFSAVGILLIIISSFALSLSTTMVCRLRSMVGSAQISMSVRSRPFAARPRAAATFTLAGKPLTASRAVPSNTLSALDSPSRLMPFSRRYGAP